jgi:hypothetical protein
MGGPETGVVGNGSIFGVEALGRGVEQPKTFGGHTRDDFRRDASPGEGFADAQ